MESSSEQQMSQPQQMMPPSGGTNVFPDSKADLLDKIQPEKAVEIIKQTLMGNQWDESKGEWISNPALKNFALTEYGAMVVSSLIYPACSQNTVLSNLSKSEINNRIYQLVEAVLRDMLDYHHEMGMQSQAHFYHIKEIVFSIVQSSMTQSEREGIRRLLNSTISESRNVNTYGEERGMLGGLFRRRS